MTKHDIIHRMINPGVIAVIRADSSEQLLDAARAMAEGGVIAMEVTMTTPNAIDTIKAVVKELGDKVLMGVGTVLDDITARLAILAGAEYVVTPVMRPDVIALCRRYSKPIVCGAVTPTEALNAHEAGADFVKLFPADTLGPTYIKALKAPLPQLQIIPTGGVTTKTAGDFIKAGCAAVAAGSSLVSKDVLAKKDWKSLTEISRQFVEAVAVARKG
ncbi:bifunctional 4-hydroxy-2-oxoglutarate aldolase/2-dehydro-3-deoxy-phosphogluconate aldolase [Humisphaera borealis]|uniref:Bifunctional 4-hydroxy-2-oxoglutarate aldolase/2-dehydro-3-deoxy-phosphogluconate aldolase n=1 Tax=Humisphaera borealis TaxID=2807512 RepID=A0A7M2WU57_9BACT|nr:bifunctional 4-hydroxy-2-oxoglutarate aldolase/2-dehydro-3-deoxy-phosphogluconate aldolase [Humisphaera borealis]QOV88804.1 bifunctional 4-hydroxy-2-oxoglutarate aldolase/2-dehydro-3-deoxy-phosphogluconate aldolase [Humisphaera borealis]